MMMMMMFSSMWSSPVPFVGGLSGRHLCQAALVFVVDDELLLVMKKDGAIK